MVLNESEKERKEEKWKEERDPNIPDITDLLDEDVIYLAKKFGVAQNPDSMYVPFNGKLIEINERNVRIYRSKNGGKKLLDGRLEILHYVKDEKNNNLKLFWINFENTNFYSYSPEDFIASVSNVLYGGQITRDVIKAIFEHYAEKKIVPEKKAEYILGFNNGWKLPLVKNRDYDIVMYTMEQRNTYKSATKMYKNHRNPLITKFIKKQLKLFVEYTQTEETALAIIIGWCVAAPFKLFFVENLKLFPILNLEGPPNTGKTYILDFFAVNFYRLHEYLISSGTMRSVARLEDIFTGSTFPIITDEWNDVDANIVNLVKETCSGVTEYKRKTSVVGNIVKPKVVSIGSTSNNLGDYFRDIASVTKCVNLRLDRKIKYDGLWTPLSIYLKKKKLFSFIYDYTKDWKNSNVSEFVDKSSKKFKYDKMVQDWKTKNPNFVIPDRIEPTAKCILFGINLFERVFEIKLKHDKILEYLISARMEQSEDLVTQFKTFLEDAINYDPNNVNYRAKTYISCAVEYDAKKDWYVFSQNNLKDFKKYTFTKINGLKNLAENIRTGMKNPSNLKLGSKRIGDSLVRVIFIKRPFVSL